MEITSVEPFLTYFEKVRERTLRVARCIPPDQLEWRPREGAFSFGDLLRHLGAIERYMFAENAVLRPSRYPGHGRELAEGYEEVFAFLDRMHAEAVEIFAGLSPSAGHPGTAALWAHVGGGAGAERGINANPIGEGGQALCAAQGRRATPMGRSSRPVGPTRQELSPYRSPISRRTLPGTPFDWEPTATKRAPESSKTK
jgi:DinB family protein